MALLRANVQHNTGETAPNRGVYHSNCKCREEWRIRRGDVFPACPKCQRPVLWLFTRAYIADEPPSPPRAPAT